MASIGSTITPNSTVQVVQPTTPIVENVTIGASNVEQSHTFPANTKTFLIKVRGQSTLKLSMTAAQSGTVFYSLGNGDFYSSPSFDRATTTIYFQSPLAGLVVELFSWA